MRTALAVALVALVVLAPTFSAIVAPKQVAGMQGSRHGSRVLPATPVAARAPIGDPLDGEPQSEKPSEADPLDGVPPRGNLPSRDPDAPDDLDALTIERSGRPSEAGRSDVAYDNDVRTLWRLPSDGEDTWLWLDLGDGKRLRAVRWLVDGRGTIEVSVSSDRERWQTIDRVDTGPGWDGIALRSDARYVRLAIENGEEGDFPAIAEIAVYGRDTSEVVTRAQDAKRERQRTRGKGRSESTTGSDASREDGGDEARSKRTRQDAESDSGPTISAKKGKTRCKGERNRCRAREGTVRVEEDCTEDGSCVIDVRADGGSAVCDAAGGRRNRAGDGEGRRAGEGGECEAAADGGAVTIGDINP